jgi:hypothetical protein
MSSLMQSPSASNSKTRSLNQVTAPCTCDKSDRFTFLVVAVPNVADHDIWDTTVASEAEPGEQLLHISEAIRKPYLQ